MWLLTELFVNYLTLWLRALIVLISQNDRQPSDFSVSVFKNFNQWKYSVNIIPALHVLHYSLTLTSHLCRDIMCLLCKTAAEIFKSTVGDLILAYGLQPKHFWSFYLYLQFRSSARCCFAGGLYKDFTVLSLSSKCFWLWTCALQKNCVIMSVMAF